ncbi:hypothetical protein FHG87_007376 [Trinorchestia longiramus]|nr:hypothetical protein FHG87_007376 [Trinorchestia longiramus]
MVDDPNPDIHDMKEYIRDHKLLYGRMSKKCLWALELAKKLSSHTSEGPVLDEDTRLRLQCAVEDTHSNLVGQFEVFRRASERQLEGDVLGLYLLPSFEQWLDNFDHEDHSQQHVDADEELKLLHKTEKPKKKRLDSESSTGKSESIKSFADDAQKSKTESQQATEPQKGKKKRGPYKKKTPEEKKAIKMAGAKIEQLLMDITESKNNNSENREGRDESILESSPEKSMSKEATEPKRNTAKSSKIHVNRTVASDSDDFVDCPSPFDNKFGPSPVKQSRLSDSGSVVAADSSRSPRTNSALTKQNNSLDVRKKQPVVVSEKSLFGDDSSDECSDAENSTKNEPDSKAGTSQNKPVESPVIVSSGKKLDGSEQSFNLKQLTTKEDMLPIGRSIHGVAKVGRVFDRQVVSSCDKKGHQQRLLKDEPIKLGASKMPPAPSYNVKEIGNLMRECMKEKQKALVGSSKTSSRVPGISSPVSVDAVPTVCKRRTHSVFAPIKTKRLPNSNASSAASQRILSMEEESLTKYKSQNKDPSMFSSSDSSDDESVPHSSVRHARTQSPVKIIKNPDKSLGINDSSATTPRSSPTNPKVSLASENFKNSFSINASSDKKTSELNDNNEIEHCSEVSTANIPSDVHEGDLSLRSPVPDAEGSKESFTSCNQSKNSEEEKSSRKLFESTRSRSCEADLNGEFMENVSKDCTVAKISSLENENKVTETTTNSESEHSGDRRAILSDDLAMSSDSDDDDDDNNNDCVKSAATSHSPVRNATHAVFMERINLSDASPEQPSSPPSFPLCSESPAKELTSSPVQPAAEESTNDLFDIANKDNISSITSTPIKEFPCRTSPLDVSDVVKGLSLDDLLVPEKLDEMVQNDLARTKAQICPAATSDHIDTDNERVTSIFDDEDSCLAPTPSKSLQSQVPDALAANKKVKIPTAYTGLDLSLTDDSDGESENIKTSIASRELGVERYSSCQNSGSKEKCSPTDQLPALGKFNNEENLEDSVFIGSNDEGSASIINSISNERFSNSEVSSGKAEHIEDLACVNADDNFFKRNSSSVVNLGSEASSDVERHKKSVSCINLNKSQLPLKDMSVVVSSSNLKSDSELSVDKVVNSSDDQETTEKITLNNVCAASEITEKCISTVTRSPVLMDTHSDSVNHQSKGSSPVCRTDTRGQSRRSSVSSRMNSSSADSKTDFGSPHSYDLRKRVSSHDSDYENTPRKVVASKKQRTESGSKFRMRCRQYSFNLISPTADQVQNRDSFSVEPCSRGRITRQNSIEKREDQRDDIRSIFDVLKSPNLSGETQNFDLPSDIVIHPTEEHNTVDSINERPNKISHPLVSRKASRSTVGSPSSSVVSECSSKTDVSKPPAPSNKDEPVNSRVGFLPPVIVQTRRSSRQRRASFSYAISRSKVQKSFEPKKDISNADSLAIKSSSAENESCEQSDTKQNLIEGTTDLLHSSNHCDIVSLNKVRHQKSKPLADLNTSISSEDDSEMMSCDKKSGVLALKSVLETSLPQSDQKKTNAIACCNGLADSTQSQKPTSKENEVATSDVQTPFKNEILDSHDIRVNPTENAKDCASNKFPPRFNSRVSSSKTAAPVKPSCVVDPTSRVIRRRKAMVFKSTRGVIVGTPPRPNLNRIMKRSLSPNEISSGNVDETASKSESGREKLKKLSACMPFLSPQKSDVDSETRSREVVCLPHSDLVPHRSSEPHVQNNASEANKFFENSTETNEETNVHSAIGESGLIGVALSSTQSVSSKSNEKEHDNQLTSTKSTSTKLCEPARIDSDSSSSSALLKIDTSVSCLDKVNDDSESEGEMCINIEGIEDEAAPPTINTCVPPAFDAPNSPSSVLRVETINKLGLFDEDISSSDDGEDQRKKQSSSVQRKRKRLCSETEARLEPNVETSNSKCDTLEILDSQNKKHKPSSEKLPSISLKTKSKVINSTPRPTFGKKGSFSISQLQELERRKLTASKTTNSITPVPNIRGPATNNKVNEHALGGRSSPNSLNEGAKTHSGNGTYGMEQKKPVIKERKQLARRTARLSKSAAAAATAAARRTMTGQRPMGSHMKPSVPSPDDSSSDELNVKRTPGKSYFLIESDSEPEASSGTEKHLKVRKTLKERGRVNGSKCLDLNSVVRNLAQKSIVAKKSSILLQKKYPVNAGPFPARSSTPPAPLLDKPCVNYTVKETEVFEEEHIKNLKNMSQPTSLRSSQATESCANTSTSGVRSVSPVSSQRQDEEDSDNESALEIDIGEGGFPVNRCNAADTHSTKTDAVKVQHVEPGTATKSANILSAKKTINASEKTSVHINAVTMLDDTSKVDSASDCNLDPKSKLLTACGNRGKRSKDDGSENMSSAVDPAVGVNPVSIFGKDVLMSPYSDDEEEMEDSDIFHDPSSSVEGLGSVPPTSTGSSEYCPIMRVPPIPANLTDAFEEAQLEYSAVLRELVDVRLGSAEWNTSVKTIVQGVQRLSEDLSIPTCTYLQPLVRAFIESIMCVDPTENLTESVKLLCPELYKLFMLVKVIEANLNVTPAHCLEDLITSTCENLVRSSGFTGTSHNSEVVTLNAGAVASLCSWHTASCCLAKKEDRKPQWRRARAFIVSLLCHYPGLAHGALLSSLFLGRFVLLRLVKYRSTTGLERVIMWLVHHGAWSGKSSVRALLIENMKARYACENSLAEPMVLVRSVLETLLNKVDKTTQACLDTPQNLKTTILGLVVLSCWKGKTWVLNELLPFVVRLLACKKHVSHPRLCEYIVSITDAVLPRVGVQQAEIVDLLQDAEEKDGAALFSAAKYKDQKLKPDSALVSKLLAAFANALRKLLHDQCS